MKNIPLKLSKGDCVALISTARKVVQEELQFSIHLLESWGLEVCLGKNLLQENNQFAGTVVQRSADLQTAIDDASIKAVFFVRGGYGSVQVVDRIHWGCFQQNPKWLIGFSDITVFHSHIHQNLGIPSLHAAMPITFAKNTKLALDKLKNLIFGDQVSYQIDAHDFNRIGNVKGKLIGGNLSILYSLLGSESQVDTQGKILFIEDLDEYLYHIDRMMQSLKRAGMLHQLAGLVVGGMSDMNDNTIPYGKTAEEIIRDVVLEFDYPVCFGFPAGHIEDNCPLVFGEEVCLEVGSEYVKLS